jgi:hypothetical protein
MVDSVEHRHSNPSPSHAVAAWCNGSPEDPGCGGPIILSAFRDRRQDEPEHESYLGDLRNPLRAVEPFVAGFEPPDDWMGAITIEVSARQYRDLRAWFGYAKKKVAAWEKPWNGSRAT